MAATPKPVRKALKEDLKQRIQQNFASGDKKQRAVKRAEAGMKEKKQLLQEKHRGTYLQTRSGGVKHYKIKDKKEELSKAHAHMKKHGG